VAEDLILTVLERALFAAEAEIEEPHTCAPEPCLACEETFLRALQARQAIALYRSTQQREE
jgi:hypothetical protein